jgi:uncharacterized protein YjbJ (UPF0337 family)
MDKVTDEAKGRIKEAAGDLTDDDGLKREGKVDRAEGTVKEKVGDVADKVKDAVNPDDEEEEREPAPSEAGNADRA